MSLRQDSILSYGMPTRSGVVAPSAPFTYGCWVNLTTNNHQNIFGWLDSGGTNYTCILSNSSTFWAGFSGNDITAVGVQTPNVWQYVVVRANSVARRITVLNADGSVAHGSTTGGGSNGEDVFSISDTLFSAPMTGMIAEAFWADADIQADGAQLSNETFRQLAYRGPFSFPHFAPKVVEYHSFRSGIVQNPSGFSVNQPIPNKQLEDYYRGSQPLSLQGFSLNAGGSFPPGGPHPPLRSDYVRPGQTQRIITV